MTRADEATPAPLRSRAGLTVARLQEIEAEAQRTFALALEQLSLLGLDASASLDTDFLASLLTGTNPEARPNLMLHGERVAGLLRPRGSSVEILYEAFHPSYRQRFSVAHELGHYYLHAGEGKRMYHRCPARNIDPEADEEAGGSDMEVVSEIEAEADAYAAAFLLPAATFVAALAEYGNGSEFLAQLFHVSQGVVRNRMATLKLIGVLP